MFKVQVLFIVEHEGIYLIDMQSLFGKGCYQRIFNLL